MANLYHLLRSPSWRCRQSLIRRVLRSIDFAYHMRTFHCRGQLKCDGTRAESRFRFSAKRTSPFKSTRASVQSTTGSWGVHISGSNGSNTGYAMFRGSVWKVPATHSIRQFPLHFPSRASLCAITFQLESTTKLIDPRFVIKYLLFFVYISFLNSPSCNNRINRSQWLLVSAFYSGHHQTMHNLELKKNHVFLMSKLEEISLPWYKFDKTVIGYKVCETTLL
jgi:hypothetical protein